MSQYLKNPCDSQTVRLRLSVRVRPSAARADRCLGWNAWCQLLIRDTRRPTKDPLVGSMYVSTMASLCVLELED